MVPTQANVRILAALVEGKKALTTTYKRKRARSLLWNQMTAEAAVETVTASIQLTYLQATLRYAYKIDDDLKFNYPTGEHRGEGMGFWRVVEPFISAKNPVGAKAITQMCVL